MFKLLMVLLQMMSSAVQYLMKCHNGLQHSPLDVLFNAQCYLHRFKFGDNTHFTILLLYGWWTALCYGQTLSEH